MRWFKLYAEARNDAKLRTLPDNQFRTWFNLMCLASEQKECGFISGYTALLLAIEVCNGDVALLDATLDVMKAYRIVSVDGEYEVTFLKFAERQHDAPSNSKQSIAARVAKHRENRKDVECNEDVTTCNALHEKCNETEERRREENRLDNSTENNSSPIASADSSKPERQISFSKETIENIYRAYPRKEAKGAALKAIESALKRLSRDGPQPDNWDADWPPMDAVGFLTQRVQVYAISTSGTEEKFIPHPATWFNEGRYLNEISTREQNGQSHHDKPHKSVTNLQRSIIYR